MTSKASRCSADAQVATYCASVRAEGKADGKPIGVLAIHFDWEPQARAIVQGVRVGASDKARVLLVDSNFRVIAASDGQGLLSERVHALDEGPAQRLLPRARRARWSPTTPRLATRPTRGSAGTASSSAQRSACAHQFHSRKGVARALVRDYICRDKNTTRRRDVTATVIEQSKDSGPGAGAAGESLAGGIRRSARQRACAQGDWRPLSPLWRETSGEAKNEKDLGKFMSSAFKTYARDDALDYKVVEQSEDTYSIDSDGDAATPNSTRSWVSRSSASCSSARPTSRPPRDLAPIPG